MLRRLRRLALAIPLSICAPVAAEDPPPPAQRPPPPSLAPRPAPPRTSPAPALDGEKAEAEKDAASTPAGPMGPVLTVAQISDDVVTLAGPNVGLSPKQVGRVLGHDGAPVGRVVIDRVLENGVVGRVTSGRENIRWGARVRFEVQPAKR